MLEQAQRNIPNFKWWINGSQGRRTFKRAREMPARKALVRLLGIITPWVH
jgi:hypothetical protein